MQDLRITLVQADQIWEDKSANFNNYLRLLNGVDTDIIVLPEMFNTGFTMSVGEMAEAWDNSSSLLWLKELSASKHACIYASLIIQETGKYYNRGVFIRPEGTVEWYDKRKLFSLAGEDLYFTPGVGETIVNVHGWNIQLQICYDLRFPEIVRNKFLSNHSAAYDVILYVANWPEKRNEHWKCLLRARAIENQCYVIGVNRVGVDQNDLSYSGDSMMVNALGSVETLQANREEIRTFVIKQEELNLIREKMPFLKDMTS